MSRLPDAIEDALRTTGLPWSAETGGKRTKIRLDGRLVAVVSKTAGGGPAAENGRALRNAIAQIRRAARGQPQGPRP